MNAKLESIKYVAISKKIVSLLPLFAFYIVLILLSGNTLEGDEFRYLRYATDMVHGFYTDSTNPDLSNGPGYPLILYPFVALGLPLMTAKLFNGVFVFVGIVYLYKTYKLYINKKLALIFAYILGVYPPLLRWMTTLYSESFAFILTCGLIFYFCTLHQNRNSRKRTNLFLASLFLGLLVLTKVVFFYVLLVSTVLLCITFLMKDKKNARWPFFILLGAILVNLPFIFYAYSITGKPFYLGTRGGEILYHRSTPYENEWGNWFSAKDIIGPIDENDSRPYDELSSLRKNHQQFYLNIQNLSNIEKDSVFKAKALQNIKEYPYKYLQNTVANVGRFVFNYPISYRSQNLNAYGYIIPNMFIVVLFLLILFPAFLKMRTIPYEIKALLIFGLIYGGGMILLGGKSRYFTVMVPFLTLFLVYCYCNLLRITIDRDDS